MQAQLFGLLDLAQDAQTRTASSVELEKRRLLKALEAKTARLSAEGEIGSMESMLYTGREAVAARPVAGCRCDACCVRPIAGLYNKHPGRRPARL